MSTPAAGQHRNTIYLGCFRKRQLVFTLVPRSHFDKPELLDRSSDATKHSSGQGAFVIVVDNASFVRAVDAIDCSKAAVSRLVADLEGRLGVRLLNRTTRKLSLK
jgi:hypothetical protein